MFGVVRINFTRYLTDYPSCDIDLSKIKDASALPDNFTNFDVRTVKTYSDLEDGFWGLFCFVYCTSDAKTKPKLLEEYFFKALNDENENIIFLKLFELGLDERSTSDLISDIFYLLRKKELTYHKNNEGNNAFMIAAQNGHLPMVKAWCKPIFADRVANKYFAEWSVLKEPYSKDCPKHVASPEYKLDGKYYRLTSRGEVSIAAQTTDVNSKNEQNNNGNTALMVAVQNKHIEVVKFLLNDPDIDINIKNHASETAYDIAKKINNPELMELFKNRGKEEQKIPECALWV